MLRNLLHECLRSHKDTRCLSKQAAQRLRRVVMVVVVVVVVVVVMMMMVRLHLHLILVSSPFVMSLLDQAICPGSHLGPLDGNDRARHAGERRRVGQTCKAET